ncbi:uncharacterized protein LOC124209288 [Daphnia pulex]|uniref:uncharacterized protein LOC124209288 n=1 Tax=Daphnia pulex TaxID=6669 RepID=UPI001EDCAF86|nr:uncharacterized protein LOC124209288 [Daphnia pulex]
MKKPVMVVIFSVFGIILGMASVGVQLAALILYTRITEYVEVGYDVVACGIWCGFLYIGAGAQGLYSSYNRPKALMLTVFTAGIAVCGALVASTLSGLTASSGYTSGCSAYHYTSSCVPWRELEWSLMTISILSGLNNITLMYFAYAARKSSKCQPRSFQTRINTIAVEGEPPGPYSDSRRNTSRPQSGGNREPVIQQADI